MKEFLDPSLCNNFREVINRTPIFIDDVEYKVHYNLLCAVMDRLDSSIEYINNHLEPPETEEELLFLLMFSCMVVDAVKLVLRELEIKSDYENLEKKETFQFFKNTCLGYPLNLSKEQCPSDDKFFEYFRSVAFAHPFETSRPKFLQKDEVQYSPWVISNSRIMMLRGVDDGIGVRLYSNKFDQVKDLIFPFDNLKNYILSRYKQLEKATIKMNEIIHEKKQEWRKQKVNRSLSAIDTLKEIIKTLESRYESISSLDEAVHYLDCGLTNTENSDAISTYREALIKSIPDLCDATDNLDYEKLEDILSDFLRANPKKMYPSANYHLEKIYTYLTNHNNPPNIAYGLQLASLFAKEFANKWVTIIPDEMSFAEIQLLVSAACFLEKENQEKELNL